LAEERKVMEAFEESKKLLKFFDKIEAPTTARMKVG
jgi:hypothetical protein